jgi:nicotinate-nucleotide adenylyltransferase
MTARRLGLLGGTFDPIHLGHTDLASLAQTTLSLTQVLVIPANVPPHRTKPLTSSFHRFAMTALAVAGREGWRASDVELRHEAPSYTTTTLGRFNQQGYQPTELFFLIGADAFADITTWREYPQILDRAHFAVVSRPAYPVARLREQLRGLADRMVVVERGEAPPEQPSIILIDGATADVSSTAIRVKLSAGESIEGMVDDRVRQHIAQHGLYRSASSNRQTLSPMEDPPAGRLHGQN